MADPWLWPVGLGALGAIIGSFIATLVIRWPEGRSVMRGRSQCDSCDTVLGPGGLVPLFRADRPAPLADRTGCGGERPAGRIRRVRADRTGGRGVRLAVARARRARSRCLLAARSPDDLACRGRPVHRRDRHRTLLVGPADRRRGGIRGAVGRGAGLSPGAQTRRTGRRRPQIVRRDRAVAWLDDAAGGAFAGRADRAGAGAGRPCGGSPGAARRPRAVRRAAGERGLPGLVVPARQHAMKIAMLLPALLLGQAAPPASIAGLPLGAIPRQTLPEHGCAAILRIAGSTRALVAMASAEPGSLRLSIDGTITDLPRAAQQGVAGFGFAETTEYRAGATSATFVMSVKTRGDLKDGAAVPEATLRLDRDGKDSVVVPVAGLFGCSCGGF